MGRENKRHEERYRKAGQREVKLVCVCVHAHTHMSTKMGQKGRERRREEDTGRQIFMTMTTFSKARDNSSQIN